MSNPLIDEESKQSCIESGGDDVAVQSSENHQKVDESKEEIIEITKLNNNYYVTFNGGLYGSKGFICYYQEIFDSLSAFNENS